LTKASIIIPTKNGGEIFKKVLDAVLVQKIDDKFEVIIIDSGSNDTTVPFIRDKQNHHQNLKLYEIDPNSFGHGKTRNYGASLAKGEFLVFITQDAQPYNDQWLKELLKPFTISENVVGVFSKHMPYSNCDLLEKENLKKHFEAFGEKTKVFQLENRERYANDINYQMHLCFYSDNSSAMRSSIWKEIPYDDVDFAEDQLWAKKILEKGYSKAYAPHSIVFHSHNYSLKELFMRSYDEYMGLYEIYQYVPIKHAVLLPLYIIKRTVKDLTHIYKLSIGVRIKIDMAFLSFFKNTCQLTGAYLGVRAKQKNRINTKLSREHTIKGSK